jgi:hypothetical protein
MILCDFCGICLEEERAHRLRAISFISHAGGRTLLPVGNVSEGDWAACDQCYILILENNWEGLAVRSADIFEMNYPSWFPRNFLLQYLRELHQEFREARL